MLPARLFEIVPTGAGQAASNMPEENVQVPTNLSTFLALLLQPAAASRITVASQPAVRAVASRGLARRLGPRKRHLQDAFDEISIKIASFFSCPGQVLAV